MGVNWKLMREMEIYLDDIIFVLWNNVSLLKILTFMAASVLIGSVAVIHKVDVGAIVQQKC